MKAKPIYNPVFAEPTESERDAQRALNNERNATNAFVEAVKAGLTDFWGTPGNILPWETLNAKLQALGAANWQGLAARHAAAMQYLIGNDMLDTEAEPLAPWRLTTPYEVTVSGDTITLGEALNEAWGASE